jgi:urease beta subunit
MELVAYGKGADFVEGDDISMNRWKKTKQKSALVVRGTRSRQIQFESSGHMKCMNRLAAWRRDHF